MPETSARGRFITFEGGEGVGKSTQIKLLAKRLRDAGIDVLTTHEPGGTPAGQLVRALVLADATKPFGPNADALLMAAARRDHVRSKIAPALAGGIWVLCDRFMDSTRVYQVMLEGADADLADSLEMITVAGTRPDLTIILDLDPEIAMTRVRARGGDDADRFDSGALAVHKTLRKGFLSIAETAPERCSVIDAGGAADTVAAAVWDCVRDRFTLQDAATKRAVGRG